MRFPSWDSWDLLRVSVGKLGSSWKTLRLGGGGVRGGFNLACRRSWGVVGGVMKLCRARGVSRPLACRGIQVSEKPSLRPGTRESEAGRADTETERGPWALLPSLPSWELPGSQGRLAGDRVSTEGPELLSRRASNELQPESSLCSPPVDQGVSHRGLGLDGTHRCHNYPEMSQHCLRWHLASVDVTCQVLLHTYIILHGTHVM
jgi:hypothetical protein